MRVWILCGTVLVVLLLTACSQQIDCIQYGWKYESIQNTWFKVTESSSNSKVARFGALTGEIRIGEHHYQGNYCLTEDALYFYQYKMSHYGLRTKPIKIKLAFYEPRKMKLTFSDGRQVALIRPRE